LLTDLRLGGDSGMEVLDEALSIKAPPVSIMMTAYGSVDTAVEAMRRGAWNFVTKPLNLDGVELLLKRALRSRRLETENQQLRDQAPDPAGLGRLTGKSPQILKVIETVKQVAPTRATVLIEGESGTGKEVVAHAIHQLSGRPAGKLIIVHCAALSPQLLESELFGHEKGAFTGASQRRIGRFEQADGGTLFLDEIGEIDATTQVKLLRALSERTIERVGSNTSVKVDVRVLAATNRDLATMVEAGDFREDLYFRLNVVRIAMPPLRERAEDIVLLTGGFLREFAEENGRPVKPLSDAAMACLRQHTWPGNVRELRTAIEHGVVMSNDPVIDLQHLPAGVRGDASVPKPTSDGKIDLAGPPEFNLHALENRTIRAALAQAEGNRTHAANLLGISRRTLQRKLKEIEG
ncbi:MAG: sigma-54-dependent transcriptional regulator, partial [Verrucomicrobiales bacterium]